MGYFGKQIYNEPMSMYVDPRLDILANSLQAVQKRHDENYAQMSALDLMAHNTKVAEGDRGIKEAALGRLKAQRDAIAASGDYAYAMPKIGAAVRDWSGDEDLIAAKDNEVRIAEAEKTRQAMRAAGHIDLDFNPSDNWTTIDPITKQRRKYTSQIEKELDYNAAAQEVTKLMADTRDLGLTPANIRDYLRTGSVSGISDAKVKANLEGSINRFMTGTAGDQLKRKLTRIKGMSNDEADDYIANFLYDTSKAQVYRKEDANYQVNSAALQRDQMAQQERHWQAEMELKKNELEAKKVQDATENEIKRVKAAGKLKEDGTPFPESPARAFFNAKETTVTPATLSKIMPMDKDGNFEIDMSKNLLDFGKTGGALKPEDVKFMTAYEAYRNELGDKDISPEKAKKKRYELETEYEKLQKNIKYGKVYFPNQRMSTTSNPKGWVEGANLDAEDIALAKKKLDETSKKLATLKALEEASKKQGFDLDDSKRYAKLNQDAASKFGQALQLAGTAKFKTFTNKPNKVNVDGKSYIKGEVTYTQAELNTLMENYKRKDSSGGYNSNSDRIPGWTDDWEDVFVEKGIIKPAGENEKGQKIYNIPVKYQIQDSPDIHRAFNQGTTTESVYKENAEAWDQSKADDDYLAAFNRKYKRSIETKLNSIKDPALNAKVEELLYNAAQAGETGLIERVLMTPSNEIRDEFKRNGIL